MPIINLVYEAPTWWGWWQPWVNTVAYYPLTSTTTTSDESGNWHTLSNHSVQFWTYNWVDCANCNIVYSHSNNNISIYVNWVSYYNGWVSYNIKTGYTAIWCWVNYENPVIWNFSNVIFENIWWTAGEVADYYNQTKAIYGL